MLAECTSLLRRRRRRASTRCTLAQRGLALGTAAGRSHGGVQLAQRADRWGAGGAQRGGAGGAVGAHRASGGGAGGAAGELAAHQARIAAVVNRHQLRQQGSDGNSLTSAAVCSCCTQQGKLAYCIHKLARGRYMLTSPFPALHAVPTQPPSDNQQQHTSSWEPCSTSLPRYTTAMVSASRTVLSLQVGHTHRSFR